MRKDKNKPVAEWKPTFHFIVSDYEECSMV